MFPLLAPMVAALGLVVAAMPPPDWSRAQPLVVIATEYGFAPDRLTVRAGLPYRLHLENHGREMHEFTAPAFLQGVALGNPDVLNAAHTELILRAGEQGDLYFVPRQAGRYPFACADHDWAGMTGEILVEVSP